MTLELDGVAKAYGAFALGPVDLTVDEEVVSVLGPSGCGKTTLLSVVAGVVDPDAGECRLDGRSLAGRPTHERGAALVFQDGALFPHMTARENVAYAADSAATVDSLAERLEIGDVLDRPAAALSGGERQRVALARALAAEPDALLLDEPLANLDAPIRRRLRHEMRDLLAALSVPVVHVTHDQRDAAVVGDRVAVMTGGEIQQVGPPAAVFERPATPAVAAFTGTDNLFRARVRAGADGHLDWDGRRLAADVDGFRDGEDVWFCVRPERVSVHDGGAPANAVSGTVERCVFEGRDYLLTVAVGDDRVDARLAPPAHERLAPAEGATVEVALPPAAIHVLEA